MSSVKLPYFDYRIRYDANVLYNHKIQKYIALFLSNPENYRQMEDINERDKQDYFMSILNTFFSKYIILSFERNFDEYIYFLSLNIDKQGSVNINGGGDRQSPTAKRERINDYKETQNKKVKFIEYLNKKYGILITSQRDNRLFLGHTEIWKNPSPELLKLEGWEWVLEKSYDDETLAKPFPEDLDSDLIPLNIRNKVLQKWRHIRSVENEKKMKQAILQKRLAEEERHKNPSPKSVVSKCEDDDNW